MEPDGALAALPEVYADALLLHEQGLTRAEIAARVGVPASAIDSLLRLGAAKLARLLAEPADAPGSAGSSPTDPHRPPGEPRDVPLPAGPWPDRYRQPGAR